MRKFFKSKENPTYFEAILQLRDVNDELMNFVCNQIDKKEVNVAKVVEYKNGVDLYLGSQRFVRALSRKLKRSFKGELKMSRSIFATDKMTSKVLYRVTVFFKLKQQESL